MTCISVKPKKQRHGDSTVFQSLASPPVLSPRLLFPLPDFLSPPSSSLMPGYTSGLNLNSTNLCRLQQLSLYLLLLLDSSGPIRTVAPKDHTSRYSGVDDPHSLGMNLVTFLIPPLGYEPSVICSSHRIQKRWCDTYFACKFTLHCFLGFAHFDKANNFHAGMEMVSNPQPTKN